MDSKTNNYKDNFSSHPIHTGGMHKRVSYFSSYW